MARALTGYRRRSAVVLGLPRGGVPVAAEVAEALVLPLDVLVVRKLGVPGHEELAMGAVAGGGALFLNRPVIDGLGISAREVDSVVERERAVLARRLHDLTGGRPSPVVTGKTVLVVDDGLATGSTMRAAVGALRALGPEEVVVAAPVGSPAACAALAAEADDVVCLHQPAQFRAVGEWYADFRPTTDDEVRRLLAGRP
ncbi:MAG: phosphoribosyltransferase family protein [Actinomycetota bacterium]